VAESSSKKVSHFKSPARVAVQFLRRSRDLKVRKFRKLQEQFQNAHRELQRLTRKAEACVKECRESQARLRRLEIEQYRQISAATLSLPADPPLGSHGFGARMVTLSVALAQAVGFRGARKALEIVFEWLGVPPRLPHFTSIRNWLQRLGVALQQQPPEAASDWIWMADHSNQIGQEKILVVLAVRASQLPPAGTALKHQDLRVLTVRPGKSWKREDVAAVYAELAERHGAPRAILSDGAVELRESVASLKIQRPDCLTLQDFKHKAANFLESCVGKSERFAQFTAQIGATRAAIQQTELAHLTPPVLKTKARFMNLGPLWEWSKLVLWLLQTPTAQSRQWVTADRLESKLGWLRAFATDLAAWHECQQVIDRGLKFINTQGVFRGATEQLRQTLTPDLQGPDSRHLAERLLAFVADAECQLREDERLTLSTEILESSFALYKRLERQHSKGGFTSLVAAFAGLLAKPTPALIRKMFSQVSTKDVQQWVQQHLGTTLRSQRRSTYQEMKQATRPKKLAPDSATKMTLRG
jgi:hypothetical protein